MLQGGGEHLGVFQCAQRLIALLWAGQKFFENIHYVGVRARSQTQISAQGLSE